MNSMPRTLTMLVLLIAMVVGSSTVQAADSGFATLVKNLGGASFSAKLKAITALGGSGDSRAEEVLQAFLGRKLYTMKDGRVVIGASSGAMIALKDAIDGADLGSVKGSDVKSIIPNNRLRKALRGALGGLTLVSKDSTKRIAAADAVERERAAAAGRQRAEELFSGELSAQRLAALYLRLLEG